ncbi:MAG: GldG family protein [Oscillospiraceae bacterium]|nr:GldG family protein [Oscillospiraceae bacterium]
MKENKTAAKAPRFRFDRQMYKGGWSVLAAVIVLALLVLLNVAVGKLPAGWIRYDVTAAQLYSIGAETEAVVENLPMEVTVYWVASEGYQDSAIGEMLKNYDALSDKVAVEHIDPTVNPGFMSKYASDGLTQNSLIVESALRTKVVGYDSIYVTEYEFTEDYSDYTTTSSYKGENALTAALDYVTSEDLPVAYYLTGHGEPGFSAALASAVGDKNITVEQLALLSAGAVPEDAAAVIIDSPAADLYDNELQLLQDYLAAGGKLVLLTNFGQPDMPNLTALTDSWGLAVQPGLVLEGNSNFYYQYPMYMLPDLSSSSEITIPLNSNGQYVLYYMGQSIVKTDAASEDVVYTPLLMSSDTAYRKAELQSDTSIEKSAEDESGSFDLAMRAVNTVTEGELVWYSSGMLLNSELNSWTSGNNYTLFVNTMGALCEHESAISIAGKNYATESLMVSTAAAGLWKTVYTALLPLACVGVGVLVFVRRRALR